MKKNKLITFAVSLIAAIVLWIYVVTVVNTEGERIINSIPVIFSGEEVLQEDRELIITDGRKVTVSASFHGKNADLNKLLQMQEEITAVVDVTKLRGPNEYSMAYEINLPAALRDSGITIGDRAPGSIGIRVENYVSAPVEIRGDFSGIEVAEGYMLEKTTFDYDAVIVEGPENVVSTIASAMVTLKRSNLDKTVTETVPFVLCDADGKPVSTENLTMQTDSVEVTINVVKYKDVALELEFIDGGGATAKDVKYDIEPKTVTLSGDPAILDGINKIVLDTIDLSDMESSTKSYTFPIVIPNDVKNVSGVEEAEATVVIKNKGTAVLRASNIVFTNLPEGYTAEAVTKQLQLTVRASMTDLPKISANNLRIVADMTDFASVGTHTVKVEIYVDGYPEAGVIGDDHTIVVAVSSGG